MANSAEEVRKSIRTYLIVGAILFIGTVVTVLVATVPALDIGHHGFDVWDAILGLAIAATKASLVAAIFMHLNHEKPAVYWIFGSGIVFVIALFGLIGLAKFDPIVDDFFYSGSSSEVPVLEAGTAGT
jgi:caa(3)-type oxidase subunit IV